MFPIKRGAGINAAEQELALLADQIFLDLWSYPNLFFKRNDADEGGGKELCDLLAVCGDDVLIFSVKDIAWPKVDDPQLAWSRWYRSAVQESAAQIAGAERTLTNNAERVYLDAACQQKMPIGLPPPERPRVHGLAIALGATEACAAFYGGDRFFPIVPTLKGENHTDPGAPDLMPFGIGDVRPDGPFVHVFNESALELIARELDTLTDIAEYLTRRERIMRSGRLMPVSGEHDLLA